jgi:nicotinamidase-related amidase
MVHDPFYDLMPRRPEPVWEPGRMALISIDLQYLDAHPEGMVGRLARAKGLEHLLEPRWNGIEAILPNVRRLQDAFRAAGEEVMHVRIRYRTPDGRDAGKAFTPGPEVQAIEADVRDQDFLPEVAPRSNEMIFDKTTAGAFNSGDLEGVLRRMKIDHVVLTGIVTDGCVELTARDAADRGLSVTIIEDGCSAPTPEAHRDAVERMTDGGFIASKTTDEAIDLLRRSHGAQTTRA